MKLFKPLLSLIILFSASISIHSQELINLIPKESIFIGLIDLNQINTKANFEDLIKLPLVEKMDREISKELFRDIASEDTINYLNLQNYGINVGNKCYFYVKGTENIFYGALVFALSDEAKFTKFAELVTKTEDGKQTIVAGNYKYTNKNKLRIVWNSKFAAFYGVSVYPAYRDSVRNSILYPSYNPVADSVSAANYYQAPVITDTIVNGDNGVTTNEYPVTDTTNYSYNYQAYDENYKDPSIEKYAHVTAICDSLENAWSAANMGIFVQDKGSNSLAGNKDFMVYVKTNPDAACMFDYGQFAKMYMNSYSGLNSLMLGNKLTGEYLNSFYKGLSMYAKIELKQGEINMSCDTKHNEELNEIYKEVKKTSISKNFLKYLNKDVMGYYALGVDIPGMAKGVGNAMKKIYPTIPKYGNVVSSAMDVIDIFIDQQSIYKVFTGDMIMAVNGVKPVEVVHTSYNYDDNFNATEVQDTSIQMQPEILFMAGIGNVADVKKILKLLISVEALKLEGNIYSIAYKHADLPVYIKIQDDILFISNNKSYIENPKVYSADKQPGKEHIKMFKQNNFVAYANTTEIAKYFAKQGKSENEKIISQAGDLFKSVKIVGNTKNGSSKASCVFELSKSNNNSIVDIIKYLNELYLVNGKKL